MRTDKRHHAHARSSNAPGLWSALFLGALLVNPGCIGADASAAEPDPSESAPRAPSAAPASAEPTPAAGDKGPTANETVAPSDSIDSYHFDGSWLAQVGWTVTFSPESESLVEVPYSAAQREIRAWVNYTSTDPTQVIDVAISAPGVARCVEMFVCYGHDVVGPVDGDGWYQSANATPGAPNGHSELVLGSDVVAQWDGCEMFCFWKIVLYPRLPVATQTDFSFDVRVVYGPETEA